MSAERIASLELLAVDLPLRMQVKHAAADRGCSESLFLKCITESGAVGYGECLPRRYVTGETRDECFDLLRDAVMPHLRGMTFGSMAEVEEFLTSCDGRAPSTWVDPRRPHGAAWCSVDVALLDCFGNVFDARPLERMVSTPPNGLRYSGVLSQGRPLELARRALKQRAYGLRAIKLKTSRETSDDTIRWTRRLCGSQTELRVDVNMGWKLDEALERIPVWWRLGIRCFEQPLAADDIDGLRAIGEKTGACVMADESFTTRESLARLITRRACGAVNARISKCGGVMATLARCREALESGLDVQLGCQVGESSLLSSAQLLLASVLERVRYAEGCFGLHLLREDPVSPLLQLRFGGRPPTRPTGAGFGVTIDETALARFVAQRAQVGR